MQASLPYLVIDILRFVFDDHPQRPAEQQGAQAPIDVSIREPGIAENGDQHRVNVVSKIEPFSHLQIVISEFLNRENIYLGIPDFGLSRFLLILYQ